MKITSRIEMATSMSLPSWQAFLVIAGVLLIGDYIWLGHVARPMYDSLRMALNPGRSLSALPYRIPAAIVAYAFMILTLGWLALPQVVGATWQERLLRACWWGGLWALAVYGVYDFTNYAIIESFPLSTALIDLAWGIFIGITSVFIAGTFTPVK
jgi:uncharacterized membrane protein